MPAAHANTRSHARASPKPAASHQPKSETSTSQSENLNLTPETRNFEPSLAPLGGACPCGGGCPRCTRAARNLPSKDFSGVRFHSSAPEVTTPLRARAVTVGQDIYFHPDEFAPGTSDG